MIFKIYSIYKKKKLTFPIVFKLERIFRIIEFQTFSYL